MWILILFGIHIAALLLPIVARIILSSDYVTILLIAWALLFSNPSITIDNPIPFGILYQFELHTVFIILVMLVIFALWWGVQQISIFGFKIFKVLACVFSALVFTVIFIAPSVDIVWTWTLGIILFGLSLFIRSQDDGLLA